MAGYLFLADAVKNFALHNGAGDLFARIVSTIRACVERRAGTPVRQVTAAVATCTSFTGEDARKA